jgi:hypothetical protein
MSAPARHAARPSPEILSAVIVEASRFTSDEDRLADGAAVLARTLGIDEDAAVEAISEGIRQARAARERRSRRDR